MADTLTAEDERYAEMFDTTKQDANQGLESDRNYVAELNALRDVAPVMNGSPRALLGLPEVDEAHYIGPKREQWTLFSYAACERGFRENLIFSSEIYKESAGITAIGNNILNMVGPEHKRYRAVGQPLFLRPRVLDWWKRRWIDEAADSLLERLEGRETADLNLELCARLPMYVVTRAIGLEGEDALTFRRHLTDSTFGAGAVSPEQAAASRIEVDRIMTELIEDRRANGGDDVITGLLENEMKLPAGGAGQLTNQEIFSYCKLIIFAGGGTTWRQLGITIDALLSHYHFWEQCREDRSLIELAIDEALRWRPTDPIFPRLATQDVEVEGIVIPEGARVQICLGAGNRDPKVYDRPDEYDIHRPKHHHMGLGLGPHRCLGMDVAKQEMVAAISGLMDRWPNLKLDPAKPKPRFVGLDHCGMSAVTVRLAK
jgi:cytochrome P450